MCIIFLAINQHTKYKFIAAANRDEFYERPTAQAQFWSENENILAGKDLVHGGTWLGVTKTGRFAAVTNFRNPHQPLGRFSRGNLVKDFLFGDETVSKYLRRLEKNKSEYTGYSLLFGTLNDDVKISYYSNIGKTIRLLDSGIYGLSNHLLDTPWQKVVRGKKKLEKSLVNISEEKLFEILTNKKHAKKKDLPDTGIGLEREKLLSSIFIETPIYGTRSSTILLLENDNKLKFTEKNFVENSQTLVEEEFFLS